MSVQSNPERRPDGEAQQRTGSGVRLALFAAGLFGASAPFAKLLLRDATPQLLAGLLAVAFGAAWPGASQVGPALLLGFLSYGVSLVLFVLALRHLGTARTGAYFSLAPFVGALVSLGVFRERPTAFLMVGRHSWRSARGFTSQSGTSTSTSRWSMDTRTCMTPITSTSTSRATLQSPTRSLTRTRIAMRPSPIRTRTTDIHHRHKHD